MADTHTYSDMEKFYLKTSMLRCYAVILVLMVSMCMFSGCSGGSIVDDPLTRIRDSLKGESVYSVVLDDMKQEGVFFKDYYHKYLIVHPDKSRRTEWIKVNENFYKLNQDFLGMALLTKKEGEIETTPSPPGYDLVGDPKYGQWQKDSSGSSFWEFYGKYALISTLFGGWYRPVYQNDYRGYQQSRSSNRPFFGRQKEFGSSGKIVKSNRPDFFSRRMTRKSSFSDKLQSRIGRSKTTVRSRSGGFGK
ncbi:MAG: hypothetical protein U9P10_05145 [Thermodesulfobacteriota bacterium]|nr:hypothetical protein [Thermodesulfobacteriota bacterium]